MSSLLRFLTRAGFSTLDQTPAYYGLGITLGNAEVRLDEMVAAYAAFARGGEWIEPTWLKGVRLRERRRLVSPLSAYWVTDILADTDAREYIFGRDSSLELPFPVAAKTGTSQAYHDNWTVGYTRDVTVGVWVGNFDRTPLRTSSGVTGAAPIFHAVMLAATRRRAGTHQLPGGTAIVARPDGTVGRRICALSGMSANAWCPAKGREWLLPSETRQCSWHHDSDGGVLVIWPPAYRQWAHNQGFAVHATVRAASGGGRFFESPAAGSPREVARAPARALEIATPPSGATYLIDPTLRREFQTLALRATTARLGRIEWQVNGKDVGSVPSDEPLMWPLVPGTHTITARDARGHSADARINVR